MQKRLFSVSLALFFLLSLIFSVTLLGTQAGHEHMGEADCAICQQMQDCSEHLLTPAACLNTEKTFRFFAPLRKISFRRRSSHIRDNVSTPVSLKDKLSD